MPNSPVSGDGPDRDPDDVTLLEPTSSETPPDPNEDPDGVGDANDSQPAEAAPAAESDADAEEIERDEERDDVEADEAAETDDEAEGESSPDAEDDERGKLRSFDDFGLPEALAESINDMGWAEPTPVQSRCFPPFVAGRDVIVQSHTGSGKTGAFCIPWLAARFDSRPADETGVQLIVILPTRELAKQVCVELNRLSKHTPVTALPVYGGTPMSPQLKALSDGVHAVVGTPGRILDHIRRRSLKLDQVRTVVLDECDEMLSMGFLEDIRAILEQCTSDHQTCLFSATVPQDIQRIARRHMRDPEFVELSGDEISAAQIDHAYYSVSSAVKTRDLIDIIMIEDPARAIVFCNTREETKLVASVLTREGYNAEPLSSDLNQNQRERVMGLMREHKLRFLVATDVAARGIDISNVTHVINYSFPESAEVYVHRTGRTGRAGRAGLALSLIGPRELGNFYQLKLQYKSIKFSERHMPPAEERRAQRREVKLDQISQRFPDLVSPEWVALARELIGDPRGERIIALLLERALRKPRRAPPPEEEQEEAPRYESYERGDRDRDRRRRRGRSERDGERGRFRDRDGRDGRASRDRDGRDREPREFRDREGRDR
ncbi:MAG: DEAD/DEAH box helicase, partial [Myxococcales bacterium]|nr:DEAD/DEAH box helicase [Myxococcales bacterium]